MMRGTAARRRSPEAGLEVGSRGGTRTNHRALVQYRTPRCGTQGEAELKGVAQMPLQEKPRLSRGGQEKIRRLLRTFYDQLLVKQVPDRIYATINTQAQAQRSSSRPLPRRHSTSDNLP